jgi:hypothetical protein
VALRRPRAALARHARDEERGRRAGLTEATIRTDVELKLRQAGLHVLAKPVETDFAIVLVSILSIERSTGGFAYSIKLEIAQRVRLDREPRAQVAGKTWGARDVVGVVGTDRFVQVIRENVKDMTDEFLNAYLAANPR